MKRDEGCEQIRTRSNGEWFNPLQSFVCFRVFRGRKGVVCGLQYKQVKSMGATETLKTRKGTMKDMRKTEKVQGVLVLTLHLFVQFRVFRGK